MKGVGVVLLQPQELVPSPMMCDCPPVLQGALPLVPTSLGSHRPPGTSGSIGLPRGCSWQAKAVKNTGAPEEHHLGGVWEDAAGPAGLGAADSVLSSSSWGTGGAQPSSPHTLAVPARAGSFCLPPSPAHPWSAQEEEPSIPFPGMFPQHEVFKSFTKG